MENDSTHLDVLQAVSVPNAGPGRADRTLLPFIDELITEYRTLNEKEKNEGADRVASEIVEKRSSRESELTWSDANALETTLMELVTAPRLIEKLRFLRAEYRRVSEARYSTYATTAPEIPSEVPTPDQIVRLRADATTLLQDLHWLYAVIPVQEDTRSELVRGVVLRVFLPVCIGCLLIYAAVLSKQLHPAVHLPHWLGGQGYVTNDTGNAVPTSVSATTQATTEPSSASNEVPAAIVVLLLVAVTVGIVWLFFAGTVAAWGLDRKHVIAKIARLSGVVSCGLGLGAMFAFGIWVLIQIVEMTGKGLRPNWGVPPVLLVILFGALGGGVSLQRRLQSLPSDGNAFSELLGSFRSHFTIYLSPILGATFALLLYCIFAGGLLSGVLFPTFTSIAAATQPHSNHHEWFDFFWCAQPETCLDLGKLLVWAFIAGFAERLVPDTIDQIIARKDTGTSVPTKPTPATPK